MAISDWRDRVTARSTQFRDWLELQSRWTELGTLGNSNLVKASVLMPAFGYMLLLNDNIHQYLIIKYDGRLLNHLPSIWRVWFLFYGSFFLALATVLYGASCKPDLKRYKTPYEKAAAESEHAYSIGGLRGTADALKEQYASLTEREGQLFTLKQLNLNNLGVDAASQARAMTTCLIHSFLIQNLKQPNLRVFLYILFRLGIFLIAIPAIFTFVQVSLIAADSLF